MRLIERADRIDGFLQPAKVHSGIGRRTRAELERELILARSGCMWIEARSLAEPIAVLRGWDYRWGVDSIATSLAVFWGAGPNSTDAQRLASLDAAVSRLTQDFGRWQVPWGEINRIQRLDDAITNPTFDDSKPSIPCLSSRRHGGRSPRTRGRAGQERHASMRPVETPLWPS